MTFRWKATSSGVMVLLWFTTFTERTNPMISMDRRTAWKFIRTLVNGMITTAARCDRTFARKPTVSLGARYMID